MTRISGRHRLVAGIVAAAWQPALQAAEPAAGWGEPMSFDGMQLASVLLGLLAVLALFGGLVWLLNRVQATRTVQSRRLEVVGGLTFGMRDRVVLIKADGRHVLLAVGSQGIRTLSEWDGAPASEAFSETLSESRARLAGGAS